MILEIWSMQFLKWNLGRMYIGEIAFNKATAIKTFKTSW
jgi:hypothetical protein